MLAQLKEVLFETATEVPVAVTYSPTLPAFAFAPVVTPTMLGVVIVGAVPSTMPPVPVTAVPSAADTPVPSPVILDTGMDVEPHVGGVVAPVDTIACPAVEPVGLSNWTGTSVAPNAIDDSQKNTIARSRFIC
jgi:hypothetical protein